MWKECKKTNLCPCGNCWSKCAELIPKGSGLDVDASDSTGDYSIAVTKKSTVDLMNKFRGPSWAGFIKL